LNETRTSSSIFVADGEQARQTPHVDLRRPSHLDEQHWDAITVHVGRVNAMPADDRGGLIGACKDLCECVAKIALSEAPAAFGEGDDFPKLVKKAAQVLSGATPLTDGSDQSSTVAKGLAIMIGGLGTASHGLAELRNGFGSGHGHALVPTIAVEDAVLVRAFTDAWLIWTLSRLERLLANSVSILIAELQAGGFRRGLLKQRFHDVGLETLGAEEQERLGFAVAQRGGRGETFVVTEAGIDPLAHDDSWPIHYQYGIAQALLLTPLGTLHPVCLNVLAAIVGRMPQELQERLLDEVQDAPISASLLRDNDRRMDVSTALASVGAGLPAAVQSPWRSLTSKFAAG
jgi:Abortive infection C-terminus